MVAIALSGTPPANAGQILIFAGRGNALTALRITAKREPRARQFLYVPTAFQLDPGDVRAFEGFAAEVRNTLAIWGRERFDYLVNNARNSLHAAFAETR